MGDGVDAAVIDHRFELAFDYIFGDIRFALGLSFTHA